MLPTNQSSGSSALWCVFSVLAARSCASPGAEGRVARTGLWKVHQSGNFSSRRFTWVRTAAQPGKKLPANSWSILRASGNVCHAPSTCQTCQALPFLFSNQTSTLAQHLDTEEETEAQRGGKTWGWSGRVKAGCAGYALRGLRMSVLSEPASLSARWGSLS